MPQVSFIHISPQEGTMQICAAQVSQTQVPEAVLRQEAISRRLRYGIRCSANLRKFFQVRSQLKVSKMRLLASHELFSNLFIKPGSIFTIARQPVQEQKLDTRFEILMASSMKMIVFWIAASCGLVKGTALVVEVATTSETSAYLYQSTRSNNTQDNRLQRRDDLKMDQ
jgi:hypothetical protein